MPISLIRTAFVINALVFSGSALAQEAADTIYSGGPILTINDSLPSAEAVAVKNGRIIAVGALSEIRAFQGENTESFDLQGAWLRGQSRPCRHGRSASAVREPPGAA
jgi:hypothetical protein